MPDQCEDLDGDRAEGHKWELRFGGLAIRYQRGPFTLHQIGRGTAATAQLPGGKLLLPDATIWRFPVEHHEIKHKAPARNGAYGLEVYRFDALYKFAHETEQRVFYTIHDWQLAGARNSREDVPNAIEHWRTADLLDLAGKRARPQETDSYVAGERKSVPIYFWPIELWQPLHALWNRPNPPQDDWLDEYREWETKHWSGGTWRPAA